MADAGSVARAYPEGPEEDSLTTCHIKIEMATKSRPASHKCDLSTVESARNVGSPNSAYNGKMSQWNTELRKDPPVKPFCLMDAGVELG